MDALRGCLALVFVVRPAGPLLCSLPSGALSCDPGRSPASVLVAAASCTLSCTSSAPRGPGGRSGRLLWSSRLARLRVEAPPWQDLVGSSRAVDLLLALVLPGAFSVAPADGHRELVR